MPKGWKPHLVQEGDHFGRLTVLGYSHVDKRHRRFYRVRCACGVEKNVQGIQLRSGNTRSCGCLSLERKRATRLPNDHAPVTQILLQYKRHARNRGHPFELSRERFEELIRQPCYYCGVPSGNLKKTKNLPDGFAHNGIDRLNSAGGYLEGNVVPCCGVCNVAKGSRSERDFLDWIARVHSHSQVQNA